MQSLSLLRLGVVPPSILATSSLTSLVMKLLRFVAEAKKLSNHHRTPIFWSVIRPGERNLTSLKWPTAHKFLKGYKFYLTFLKLVEILPFQLTFPIFNGFRQYKEPLKPIFAHTKIMLRRVGRITVSVIGADQSKSKMEGGISLKAGSNV